MNTPKAPDLTKSKSRADHDVDAGRRLCGSSSVTVFALRLQRLENCSVRETLLGAASIANARLHVGDGKS
jgi:hypothetical protein